MTILISKKEMYLSISWIDENEINKYVTDAPLTHSLVVAKYQEKYLLIFNKWRQQWELPCGIIDEGETPRECAERELHEEINQSIKQLSFKGLMKFRLKPDDRIEYGALYSGEIDIISDFKENEEVEKIIFRDREENIGYIDEIDEKLLEFY